MAESRLHSHMVRYLAALPADEFIGRKAELERLGALAEGAVRGTEEAIAIEGPHGSGKSELLRQLALALGRQSAACLPVYLNLPAFFGSAAHGGPWGGEARTREALFRALLRQALAGLGGLDAADLQGLESDPTRLVGYCCGAGCGALAPFAFEDTRKLSFGEAWRALLGTWRGLGRPPLLLLLDGAAGTPDPALAAPLRLILESARHEGCPVFFEAPADDGDTLAAAGETARRVTLAPLGLESGLRLVGKIGQARGWSLEAECVVPILERLGPWPGWVRAWAQKVRTGAPGMNPTRRAEEAYVDLLAASPWAEGLRRRFERLIPLALRENALRLLRSVRERKQAITGGDAPAMLGLGEADSERVLAGLTRLGLLSRAGLRWTAPHDAALADWTALVIAEDAQGMNPAAVRMDLLGRLLTQPRPAPDEALATPLVERVLPDLAGRFNGQFLPPVLFHFADYYEAVGRMAPEKRRDAVRSATATVRLPETIGVAPWRPAHADAQTPAIFYARAYREGKYQRSHEEIWIAVDLSAVRMLTTPEIKAALELTRELEASLGPGRFIHWLILGDSASAEALELIRDKGCYCSGREQLSLIQELLESPVESAHEPKAAVAEPQPVEIKPADMRHTVIELDHPEAEPRAEVSSLRLPAREGSELIAALTAEKISIRSDFDPAQAGQIKTAVLEGVLNAIEHSSNREKSIDIQFLLNQDALEILIENEGAAFDPLAVPTPDPQAKLAAAHKRGWGLSLMKRFMDEVGYEPCERGTRLRLIKRRQRALAGGQKEMRIKN